MNLRLRIKYRGRSLEQRFIFGKYMRIDGYESGADCSVITKNVSLILLLKPELSCHDSPMGKALMELFLNHGASTEKLTEDMLKNAGFSKDEIKKIIDARK